LPFSAAIAASFNKALHQTARLSGLQLAVRSAGERRDYAKNKFTMKIFISYSSNDKNIVKKFVQSIEDLKIRIWFDQWEIFICDSITSEIQEGLGQSSLLVIVLSNSSTKSPWVQKELNAVLIKEIESKKVVILPALIEHCKIPLLISDKKYADFRSSFEEGILSYLLH
jgi:hypothetical protein